MYSYDRQIGGINIRLQHALESILEKNLSCKCNYAIVNHNIPKFVRKYPHCAFVLFSVRQHFSRGLNPENLPTEYGHDPFPPQAHVWLDLPLLSNELQK